MKKRIRKGKRCWESDCRSKGKLKKLEEKQTDGQKMQINSTNYIK